MSVCWFATKTEQKNVAFSNQILNAVFDISIILLVLMHSARLKQKRDCEEVNFDQIKKGKKEFL